MTTAPLSPEPDTKDWTWTLTRPCPDCGFDAPAVRRAEVPALTRHYASLVSDALLRPDASVRPQPAVWSALEYGCHVRDVCVLFAERLQLMLTEDDPLFANWDQDVTALQSRYWTDDAVAVAGSLTTQAELIADAFAAVRDDQWQRPSRRSNGSARRTRPAELAGRWEFPGGKIEDGVADLGEVRAAAVSCGGGPQRAAAGF